MQKTYYIQTLKKFHKELANLNDSLLSCNHDENCALYSAILDLLSALGFVKQEDGTLKAPKIRSIWGLRAYSKRLITYQDIEKYIENNDIDLCLEDFSDDEIESILNAVAKTEGYPNHVHQPECIIRSAVEALQHYSEDDEDDEDDEDYDNDEEGNDEDDSVEETPKKDGHNTRILRNAIDQLKAICEFFETN